MKFNEKEVGKLIQRATELHENSVGDSEYDLSLAEIESISRDLGIPTHYLIEAAIELREGKSKDPSFSLWGAPFEVGQLRLVEGELTEDKWNELVAAIEDLSGNAGTSSRVGTARQWSRAASDGENGLKFEELKLTARSVEGRTSIRVAQAYKGVVAMYILGFGFTSFLTLMVAHSLPDVPKIAELIYAGLGGVLSLAGIRSMVAVSANRYREKVSRYADRLHQVLGATSDVSEEIQEAESGLESPDDTVRTPILDDIDVAHDELPESDQREKGRVR